MADRLSTLLILSPGFPASEADSVCLPAQQAFVLSLRKNFPTLQIIILSLEYPFSILEYRWHDCRVIPFSGWGKKKWNKLSIWHKAWNRLRRLKRENRIVGLLSFWCGDCALLGTYFARLYGLTHRIWILGQDARKENRLIRWIRPHPEELIAMSDFLAAEFLRNHGIKPLHLIPNAIDTAMFGKSAQQRVIDLLAVGSLIRLKQYELFIQTVQELRKAFPSLRAVICGKGPEESHLISELSSLGLENNLSLAGELPHAEILSFMRRSRILLHPSSYEGFSTVCLEALYAGAHVISFCNPMDRPFDHWHIVKTADEMTAKALEILQDPRTDHDPVNPYTTDETALAMIKLFRYREPAADYGLVEK